ncbi:Major facilitator superfamily [Dillenia turbinata]|uniref:Major facilitator superfamily n=1 Tax=Dillenia turbinata TaxID=194707 RepID=A0AAN8UJW5_9MAGN
MKKTEFLKRYLIVILTFISTCICDVERVGARGWAAQRVGGRCALLLSFVFWSLTAALIPLDSNQVTVLVMARLLVGVAQGFIFPSIHTVLAQWVPTHENSRSVSLTMSEMYLGAAAGMLVLPSLVPSGLYSGFKYASDPLHAEHPKAAAAGFGDPLLPIKGNSKMKEENGGSSEDLVCDQSKKILEHNRISSGFSSSDLNSSFQNSWWSCLMFFRGSWIFGIRKSWFCSEHIDIAPRYAGIVMGASNTAGTLAGI